jgi:hypothetical protein
VSPELRRARARLAQAALIASKVPDNSELTGQVDERRAEYRTLALAEHIKRVVDAAPPLSIEQRAMLANLLAPGTVREVA